MKMLGWGENFGLGRFCVLHLNFPPKIWNFSGSGENFRFRQKLWVRVKILGLGENVYSNLHHVLYSLVPHFFLFSSRQTLMGFLSLVRHSFPE